MFQLNFSKSRLCNSSHISHCIHNNAFKYLNQSFYSRPYIALSKQNAKTWITIETKLIKTVQMYNYIIPKKNCISIHYFDYTCMETKVHLTHKVLNLLWPWSIEIYIPHDDPEKGESKVDCHL